MLSKSHLDSYETAQITNEIRKYAENIMFLAQYDAVVGMERRGFVLFRDSMMHSEIPFYPEKAINLINVKGKSVLIFDDSIKTGKHSSEISEKLYDLGARKVDIASYVKLKNCSLNTLEPCHLADESMFEHLRNKITQYMDERLVPTDQDHLYLIGHLKNNDRKILEKIFGEIGATYEHEPGLSIQDFFKINASQNGSKILQDSKNVDKIGIRLERFVELKLIENELLIEESVIPKVRINYDNSGNLCILPIYFSDLIESKIKFGNHNFPICFCNKYYNDEWERNHNNGKHLLSSYCILINIQLVILRFIIKRMNELLKSTNNEFIIDKLIYDDGLSIFNDRDLTRELQKLNDLL